MAHLAVAVYAVAGGPALFPAAVARLLAVLPLEKVVHHGVVLGTPRPLGRGRWLGGGAGGTQHHGHAG